MDEIIFSKEFQAKQSHPIEDPKVVDAAISALESAAVKFSVDAINDANVRASYKSNINRIVTEVKAELSTKKITVKEAAEFCYDMRNKIMAEHRAYTSAQGLAVAEKLKSKPPSFAKLLDKYAQSLFSKEFSALTAAEQSKVYYSIIESSARDRASVTAATKRLRIMGKVGIVITIALAAAEIASAENKTKETMKQGITVGSGLVGGWLASLSVSTICGPGAPVCAIAIMLAGSIAGSLIGSSVADEFDDELEEFSKWNIK
ncbi:hypothetical protein [Tolumonas lignilytica]|uniref:hypothetical protein n=1 Tax=Tolumonas lignilytica TaxID=1283284 RepID=UPI000465274E|nr:hypothetical protein [Tolumonas lignilytica]